MKTQKFNSKQSSPSDRTTFTKMASSQLRFLEQETLILEEKFQENSRPTIADCELLANRFGVSTEKIQIWFKNRRAKALKRPIIIKRSRLAIILEDAYG